MKIILHRNHYDLPSYTMSDMNDYYKEYMNLLRELAEKDREIGILRDESGIAREAIERYCHPQLLSSADKWLKAKGL